MRSSEIYVHDIQTDYIFVTTCSTKYCVWNVIDTGTAYLETVIVNQRSPEFMETVLESIWIHQHGTLVSFSADIEFSTRRMSKNLEIHGIKFNKRPARSHNKTVIIEGKQRTIKSIFERLQYDMSHVFDAMMLCRATLLSNLFSGSKISSSFALAEDYKPTALEVESKVVTAELLEPYREVEMIKALHQLIKYRNPQKCLPVAISQGSTYIFISRRRNKTSQLSGKQV